LEPVALTNPGAPYVPPLKQLFVADVTNDTRADAIALVRPTSNLPLRVVYLHILTGCL